MAVEVIDLYSSPEPDESPGKAAEGALAGFKLRKDKVGSKLGQKVNGNATASERNAAFTDRPQADPNPPSSRHSSQSKGFENHSVLQRAEHEERGTPRVKQERSNGEQWHIKRMGVNDGEQSDVYGRFGRQVQHRREEKTNGEHSHAKTTHGRASDALWTNVASIDSDDLEEDSRLKNREASDHGVSSRSFRVNKSKRYSRDNRASQSIDFGDDIEERPSVSMPSEQPIWPVPRRSLLSPLLSEPPEGLLSSLLSEPPEMEVDTSETLQRPQNPGPITGSVLAGGGLEVVRVRDESSDRPHHHHEQGTKRSASASVNHMLMKDAKKPRVGERTLQDNGSLRPRRPEAVLLDVTDPDTERVSYSDEADIKGTLRQSKKAQMDAKPKRADFSKGPNRKGQMFSAEEDELVIQLREDGLNWDKIAAHFNGRSSGAIQVRYYSKLARRDGAAASARSRGRKPILAVPWIERRVSSENVATGRAKRARNTAPPALDGFVSWASLKNARRESCGVTNAEEGQARPESTESSVPDTLVQQDTCFPSSASRILRQRELGMKSRRAWGAPRSVVDEEMKNHVYGTYTMQRQYHGTSGDVVALSWAPDGDRFAAGSIAISDNRSMQYNMERNLLVGTRKHGKLRELVEHHIPRPTIESDSDNVNGLHSMRASQDARLFKTVTATAFSPSSSTKLYTTGEDTMLRRYCVGKDLNIAKCRYEIPHSARVDLLAVSSPHGIVATGCHTDTDSVNLYRCHEHDYEIDAVFSPSRSDLQSSVPIFPYTLKWGIAYQHHHLLLAGFSGDEEKALAGETCLWDVLTGKPIALKSATRNVFDVAWNPNPSSASVSFAVASNSTGLQVSRGTRTAIQCFAPDQQEARRVLIWECPAADINDVLFCPYDENLIAAGATNGTVYIWDRRSASRLRKPLHVLSHGATENIVAHDRDPEIADTGVRFLSWGATKTRLYSGSHDGIVKVWNPYRSLENTHIDDIAPPRHERSAVMSGAFNQGHRELLVGTENGRINLFSIEGGAVYKPPQFKLETAPPPAQEQSGSLEEARSMIDSGRIETRPCGAMPFRQAVQGPNYDGPFLAPTGEETSQSEERYNQAIIAQSAAHLRKAQTDLDEDNDDADVVKADSNALAAQRALDDMKERFEHFTFAQPKAEGFQRSLLKAEKDRAGLLSRLSTPVEPCGLSCAVLPTSDEVEDSGRSELRIPQALRSVEQNAARTHVGDDEAAALCSSCFPMKALKRKGKGKGSLCASCKLKRAGLTASCTRCSGPARLQTDTTKDTLCERCSFTCFRCDGPVTIDDDTTTVSCSFCQLTWNIGVLGYELVTAAPERAQRRITSEQHQELEEYDDFGSLEREHYASLWQDTADADGMMQF